jgi:hypothetical protein
MKDSQTREETEANAEKLQIVKKKDVAGLH